MTVESFDLRITESELEVFIARMEVGLDKIDKIAKIADPSKPLYQSLPGINREMRLILGQIPGMRQIIGYYFQIKRLHKGWYAGPGALQFYLALMAVEVLIVRAIADFLRRRERERREYENLIRGYKRWSHDDYTKARRQEKMWLRGQIH